MHVAQFLHPLLFSKDHEVIEPMLPNMPFLPGCGPHAVLPQVAVRTKFPQKTPRKTLFKRLHHDGRVGSLRLADQQMHMLGHDHISNHDKTIALADLFQYLEEQVAMLAAAQQGSSLIATGSDEVQVSGAVIAMEP